MHSALSQLGSGGARAAQRGGGSYRYGGTKDEGKVRTERALALCAHPQFL